MSNVETFAQIAVEEIQNQLSGAWDELTDLQKRSATRAAQRAVELEWKKRVEGIDVEEDFLFVKATVDGFKLAGEVALYSAFWKGVEKAFKALGSFLVGAAEGLVPGLGAILGGIDLTSFQDGFEGS